MSLRMQIGKLKDQAGERINTANALDTDGSHLHDETSDHFEPSSKGPWRPRPSPYWQTETSVMPFGQYTRCSVQICEQLCPASSSSTGADQSSLDQLPGQSSEKGAYATRNSLHGHEYNSIVLQVCFIVVLSSLLPNPSQKGIKNTHL